MHPDFPPVSQPLNFQAWRDLTFLHWRYPADVVQRLVPRPLQVEQFDDSAWVSLVPFRLAGFRPRFLPALPWISRFAETNCRTYVQAPDGVRGVWFFSLDAARLLAVAGGRIGYGLPYMWSRMRVQRHGGEIWYQSRRRWPDSAAFASIRVAEGEPIGTGELEFFLTARFGLFSFLAGRLTYTAVEHAPWPLRSGEAVTLRQNLLESAGLPSPVGPPLVHVSPGVHVRVAWPRIVKLV